MSGKIIKFGVPERAFELLRAKHEVESLLHEILDNPDEETREFLSIPVDEFIEQGCMAVGNLRDADEVRGYLFATLQWIASRRELLDCKND